MSGADHAFAELRWLVTDPPLLRVPAGIEDGGALLAALADEPAALERAADTLASLDRPRRLGHHFENLVATALGHSRRFEIVARNLPLRRDGVTLGELDLLVRDHGDGALCHWELALKFYLGLPHAAAESAWPGPDPSDQLALKAQHLRDRQLPRSADPTVAALLAQQGWRVRRRVLLSRGRLFYRPDDTPAPPDDADPGHRRGLWWRPGEAPVRARPVPHRFWHLPALSDTRTEEIAGDDWRAYVERQWAGRHRSPVMLIDAARRIGFLVPDDWPAPL